MLWKDDSELFQLCKTELFTAVVGDVMDKRGYTHQLLPAHIKPLIPEMIVVGRAMKVLEADCFQGKNVQSKNPAMHKPFGLMMEALGDLKPDEVYVCTGSSPKYALWGELMSTRSVKLGDTGDVLLVWNHNYEPDHHHTGQRNPLTAAISKDKGNTWQHIKNIEDIPGGMAFAPSALVLKDKVLIAYAMQKRPMGGTSGTEIRLKIIPLEWFYSD